MLTNRSIKTLILLQYGNLTNNSQIHATDNMHYKQLPYVQYITMNNSSPIHSSPVVHLESGEHCETSGNDRVYTLRENRKYCKSKCMATVSSKYY